MGREFIRTLRYSRDLLAPLPTPFYIRAECHLVGSIEPRPGDKTPLYACKNVRRGRRGGRGMRRIVPARPRGVRCYRRSTVVNRDSEDNYGPDRSTDNSSCRYSDNRNIVLVDNHSLKLLCVSMPPMLHQFIQLGSHSREPSVMRDIKWIIKAL